MSVNLKLRDSDDWNAQHYEQAKSEGWALDVSGGDSRIVRWDEPAFFATDEDAERWVFRRAFLVEDRAAVRTFNFLRNHANDYWLRSICTDDEYRKVVNSRDTENLLSAQRDGSGVEEVVERLLADFNRYVRMNISTTLIVPMDKRHDVERALEHNHDMVVDEFTLTGNRETEVIELNREDAAEEFRTWGKPGGSA